MLFGGASVAALGACKEPPPPVDARPDMPTGNCLTGNATVMIATNHQHVSHSLTVPGTDIQAAVEKIYDIMGTATHNHQVTVTAADFETLKGGGSVMITSTATDHTHVVTISCG